MARPTEKERKSDGVTMKRLHISLPTELAKRLAHAAIDEERDMSALVADALEAYLKRAAK